MAPPLLVNHPLLDEHQDHYVADYGKRRWTVYHAQSNTHMTMQTDEFLSFSWLPMGSLLLVEQAHFAVPQDNGKSKSQPCSHSQLLQAYAAIKAKSSSLRLLPQCMSSIARERAGFSKPSDKTDKNDTIAWYQFISNNPQITLMQPPASFEPEQRRLAAWQFRSDTNTILNQARQTDYADEDDAIITFINTHLDAIAERLSPLSRSIMSIEQKRSGFTIASGKDPVRLYTIISLFLDNTGALRLRPDTNQPPGIKWLRQYVLNFTPYHFRAGIARSNLMWHGFRHFVKKDIALASQEYNSLSIERSHEFRLSRKRYISSIIETMQIIRSVLNESHNENGKFWDEKLSRISEG